jgi:hypothetical protein
MSEKSDSDLRPELRIPEWEGIITMTMVWANGMKKVLVLGFSKRREIHIIFRF